VLRPSRRGRPFKSLSSLSLRAIQPPFSTGAPLPLYIKQVDTFVRGDWQQRLGACGMEGGGEDKAPSGSTGPVLREILPKCGLVYSEKGNLSEVSGRS
jgi:hypothetical protein